MRRLVLALVALAGLTAGCSGGSSPVRIGALYPAAGPQGPQGTEEQRGVLLAAEWANAHGGVDGHRIEVVTAAADRAEEVPGAVAGFQRQGVTVFVGTHGSTMSAEAADIATQRHLLLWETGAVGLTDGGVHGGTDFIRMSPMGANLGKAAVDFVRDGLAPKLGPAARRPLRWAVAYVSDVYGRAVAGGAIDEVRATGEPLAGAFSYDPATANYPALAGRIAAVHPDVLFVASYLEDAVALRQAVLAAHIPLVANLGTSSSYCMPAFGERLGPGAVGLFASDKPDAAAVRPDALSPEGRAALSWVAPTYQARYHEAMSSHALSGFSNAYALFVHVLPRAGRIDPASVARTALNVKLPVGTLANGGGMDIAPLGAPDAGDNRAAASVIWQWVGPDQRAVVWPPPFATHSIVVPAGS